MLKAQERKDLDRFNELKERGENGVLSKEENDELAILEVSLGL